MEALLRYSSSYQDGHVYEEINHVFTVVLEDHSMLMRVVL